MNLDQLFRDAIDRYPHSVDLNFYTVQETLASWGLNVDIHDKTKADVSVKKAEIKSNDALRKSGWKWALLSRGHIKGRDWYDFVWYTEMGITPNYEHLTASVKQGHSVKRPAKRAMGDYVER